MITTRNWAPALALAMLLTALVGWAQTPEATKQEDKFVFSFRFCLAWPLPGEDSPAAMERFEQALKPITVDEFRDDEAFARAAAPPGDRKVLVSPLYSLVCGSETPGTFEGGVEGRSWLVEATVKPTAPDEVVAEVLYDLDGLAPQADPNGPQAPDEKRGQAVTETHETGIATPTTVLTHGPDGCCWVAVYAMVEPAWP